jgi:hypothetical protein
MIVSKQDFDFLILLETTALTAEVDYEPPERQVLLSSCYDEQISDAGSIAANTLGF